MSSNDQVILETVLSQKQKEIAPDLSASDYFEVFAAEQVLKDYDLSYDELQSGIVGAGGDGGIDGLYVFVNGELVREDSDLSSLKKDISIELIVVQAKTSKTFSETPIDKLVAVTADLFDLTKEVDSFATVYNDDVRSTATLFRQTFKQLAARFPKLSFRYVYASQGTEVHPNVARKVDTLSLIVKGLYSSANFQFEFAGAKELLALARRAPVTSYNLTLAETPMSSTGDVAFVCLVRLTDFKGFLSDEFGKLRRSLFESNVRDYQGRTQVNEEIQATLVSGGGEEFWWLNNGVTIVASKANQSGKSLTLEDPQIVNGLQTSTEIHQYFANTSPADERRHVLVRVVVPTKAESRDRIIKATNSQTYVPPASLRATDKIQRDIEEYLQPFGLYYDRRKNFHKNEGRPLGNVISISAMAQAVMAIGLQRPDTARARPSSLLKGDADYRKVFAESNPLDLYRACVLLMSFSEVALRNDASVSLKDRNNLRYYLAMRLSVLLAEKAQPTVDDIAKLAELKVPDHVLFRALEDVKTAYLELGATDQVAKGPTLTEAVSKLAL